jgi:hypothetical protein
MVSLDPDSTKGRSRSRRSHRKPLQEQRFSSYLTFGFQTTVCLGVFLAFYVLILVWLSPLLSEEAPHDSDIQPGSVLKPVMDPLLEKVKHMPHVPGQIIAEDIVGAAKRKIDEFRKQKGLTDATLIQKAAEQVHNLRTRRQQNDNSEVITNGAAVPQAEGAAAPGKRTGFVVLGMHRSGTSMLAGLLVTGFGYNTGGPLIGSKFDNEKGFFERLVSDPSSHVMIVFSCLLPKWYSSRVPFIF